MNADEFLERAAPLLLADEPRHNLILGVAGTVRDVPGAYADVGFWVVDGAAAMRTRPYPLILARPRDERALAALVNAIDDELPGVNGAVPEVHDFARLSGKPHHVVQEHNVFALHEVVAPPVAEGAPREATHDDLDLLRAWWEAFFAEALPHEEVGPRHHEQVTRKLETPGNGITLWEREGAVVSMCGYGSPTPNGTRVGPVYTPDELTAPARRRPDVLLPLHGRGEPDVECDLRADRLPQGLRGRGDRVRVTAKRLRRDRPVST